MKRPRVRFTVRSAMIGVALCALVTAYIGSYYRLRQRGLREAPTYGIPGFLYVPVDELFGGPTGWSKQAYARNRRLALVYVPLNAIDRAIFGCPPPLINVLRLAP